MNETPLILALHLCRRLFKPHFPLLSDASKGLRFFILVYSWPLLQQFLRTEYLLFLSDHRSLILPACSKRIVKCIALTSDKIHTRGPVRHDAVATYLSRHQDEFSP
jgi:hypothetical protein